jgi:3-hydroxyisobutyrate dehydrogenase-like beta-hydroxyacid dehydrogenase
MKLSLNLMIAAEMQLEAEAVVLAEKSGLDVAQVTQIIAGSAAGSPLTGYNAAIITKGVYEPPAFSTKLMIKDLKLALSVAEKVGVKLPAAELTKSKLEAAEAKGWGNSDFSVLTQLLEQESGYKR